MPTLAVLYDLGCFINSTAAPVVVLHLNPGAYSLTMEQAAEYGVSLTQAAEYGVSLTQAAHYQTDSEYS